MSLLGDLLRRDRVRRQWSRQRLAMAIPVDPIHLGRWERGARPMPMAVVARLAHLLDDPGLLEAACATCPVGQACGARPPGEVA